VLTARLVLVDVVGAGERLRPLVTTPPPTPEPTIAIFLLATTNRQAAEFRSWQPEGQHRRSHGVGGKPPGSALHCTALHVARRNAAGSLPPSKTDDGYARRPHQLHALSCAFDARLQESRDQRPRLPDRGATPGLVMSSEARESPGWLMTTASCPPCSWVHRQKTSQIVAAPRHLLHESVRGTIAIS
jgi:hypothetical protein